MTHPPTHADRRLILELGQGAADAGILRIAAEFARLLDAALHGVFVEDETLLALAEWPFARELRLATRQWQPFDPATLAAELRQAAAAADRRLAETVAQLAVPSRFEVVRGDPAACLIAFCRADDILVLALPRAPEGGSASGFPTAGFGLPGAGPRWRAIARGAPCAVLVVPDASPRRHGPVAAVLADATDPGLDPAARIAAAGMDKLRILLADPAAAAEEVCARAAALGVPRSRIEVRTVPPRPAGVAAADDPLAALGGAGERLIVLGRGMAGDVEAAARIAARCGVPVLLTAAPAE